MEIHGNRPRLESQRNTNYLTDISEIEIYQVFSSVLGVLEYIRMFRDHIEAGITASSNFDVIDCTKIYEVWQSNEIDLKKKVFHSDIQKTAIRSPSK